MRSLFLNVREKRLKAGWRILLFLLVFISLSSLIFIVRPLLGDIKKRAFIEDYSLIIISILALSATIAVWISRKWFDKKSVVSLGLLWNKQAIKDLLFGFLLSFGMAALFYLVLYTLGFLDLKDINFNGIVPGESVNFVKFMSVVTLGSLSLMLLETVLVGYWEELVFRGYIFQNMIQGLGFVTAIVISCILYGLIHASNPNATWLSTAIIVGFGYLRIYGYLSTKMLWLSMGMHIGWNFFQGPIFGFAASGHKKATLLSHTLTSDKDYLTGGAFGPEGSILIIPILIAALLLMKWYSKKFYL